MPKPADIRDPTFRAALEHAERLLDEGNYTAAAQSCAETYLQLLARHPELLPPEPLSPAPSPQAGGSRTPDIPSGFPNADAARAFRRNWWPPTGALNVVVDSDRVPHVEQVKERVSMSESAGYFEFLIQTIANTEREP